MESKSWVWHHRGQLNRENREAVKEPCEHHRHLWETISKPEAKSRPSDLRGFTLCGNQTSLGNRLGKIQEQTATSRPGQGVVVTGQKSIPCVVKIYYLRYPLFNKKYKACRVKNTWPVLSPQKSRCRMDHSVNTEITFNYRRRRSREEACRPQMSRGPLHISGTSICALSLLVSYLIWFLSLFMNARCVCV